MSVVFIGTSKIFRKIMQGQILISLGQTHVRVYRVWVRDPY